MVKQRKPKKPCYKYLCPHCGNDAPSVLKFGRDVRCFYCRKTYSKDERVKVSADK